MIKPIFKTFLPLSMILLIPAQALAWAHGNVYGGSTSHTYGATSHENAWGGSTEHVAGEGTTHTNAYGGSASHYYGGGWSKTGMYGGTAYGDAHYGTAYYHPPDAYYAGYHPPTTVNYYGSGCYNCGGWAAAGAAAAGVAVGAMAASSASAAASANSYAAGYAAGAATTPTYVMGAIYPTLPAGYTIQSVAGNTYYLYRGNWFIAAYGANGVYYKVVPAP